MAKPDTLARQLTEEVLALQQQAPPEGTAAAQGDFARKLRKAIPTLLTGLIEAGAIAADGQVSADEVKDIAGKVFEFLQRFKKTA